MDSVGDPENMVDADRGKVPNYSTAWSPGAGPAEGEVIHLHPCCKGDYESVSGVYFVNK